MIYSTYTLDTYTHFQLGSFLIGLVSAWARCSLHSFLKIAHPLSFALSVVHGQSPY